MVEAFAHIAHALVDEADAGEDVRFGISILCLDAFSAVMLAAASDPQMNGP